MSPFRRAFLYITRKRVKTIILFLIILVIATLVLSAIALKGAVQTAQLNVREALGGSFIVKANTDNPNKWETDEKTGESVFVGKTPSKELAESIAEDLEGLSGYCLTCSYRARVSKEEAGEDLTLVPGGSGLLDAVMQEQAKKESGADDLYISLGVHVSTDSTFDPYFMNQNVQLTEGRHIKEAETGVCMISENLAKLNQLTIGDTVYLRDQNRVLQENDTQTPVYAPAEIVGIFSVSGTSQSDYSYSSTNNMIITTKNTVDSFSVAAENLSYDALHFYAKDPGDLDAMIRSVSNRSEFKYSQDFVVSADNEKVLLVKGPLENINLLVTILIFLVLFIGVIVLWLVLSSRTKDRVHETGILLSAGIRKSNILVQYLTEITVVTILACTVAIFSSAFVTSTAGNMLLEGTMELGMQEQTEMVAQEESSIENAGEMNPEIINEVDLDSSLTEVTVSIGMNDILVLYGAGLLVSWVAVIASSISLFRLKPREILSKMS